MSAALPLSPRLRSCGWECGWTLLRDYPERLTVQEHVLCLVAVFSAPERTRDPGAVIALYVHVAGVGK